MKAAAPPLVLLIGYLMSGAGAGGADATAAKPPGGAQQATALNTDAIASAVSSALPQAQNAITEFILQLKGKASGLSGRPGPAAKEPAAAAASPVANTQTNHIVIKRSPPQKPMTEHERIVNDKLLAMAEEIRAINQAEREEEARNHGKQPTFTREQFEQLRAAQVQADPRAVMTLEQAEQAVLIRAE